MKLIKFIAPVVLAGGTLDSVVAQTWTLLPSPQTSHIVCSANGNKLASAGSSPVYVSTNSGISWSQTTSPGIMFHVATSADGTKLAAIGSVLCTSSDSGSTWAIQTNAPNPIFLTSIDSSADGTILVVCGLQPYGFIYTSTNSGMTWLTNDVPNQNWNCVTLTADGRKLAAAYDSGPIYISTNSGVSWIRTSSPTNNWNSIVSSADGEKLIASTYGNGVYSSTNYGTSWVSNSLPSGIWDSISLFSAALSGDGNVSIVTTDRGMLYVSTNSGTSWTATSSQYPFFESAVSADGGKLFVGGGDGYGYLLYTTQFTQSPQLNIETASNNLMLSWLLPSADFVLQQSFDLNDWSVVTNAPVLNLMNLNNEVTLPLTENGVFYRLKTP